jgi:transposase
MKKFISGEDRQQLALFPERLDDSISEDNPVRFIDLFIDELALLKLGFDKVEPAITGRPSYHPSSLLKIYIYGYLNRIQSSRRLERETQRNLELIWLTTRLSPDFKTIADFRKDNGVAIKKVCSKFVVLCRHMGMFTESVIAVDGSKFKAVNSRDNNYTERKLKARILQTEKRVARYLEELDKADQQGDSVPEARVDHLKTRLKEAKALLNRLDTLDTQLKESPDSQISMTDPDARSMATSGKGTAIVGYNVQSAVDDKHHLIVAHEVTNHGHDRDQLTNMSIKAKEATGIKNPKVYADRGYYSSKEILDCEEHDIVPMVPKTNTSNSRAAGRFDKQDFRYIRESDQYECPAGEKATYRYTSKEKGLNIRKYWSSKCMGCQMKSKCTTGDYRRIRRWEQEDILDKMQKRLDHNPQASRIRRQTVEHAFGTLKSWMGSTHFLTKTIEKVSTEMSLHVLAFNMKRMIAIHGALGLMRAIQA